MRRDFGLLFLFASKLDNVTNLLGCLGLVMLLMSGFIGIYMSINK